MTKKLLRDNARVAKPESKPKGAIKIVYRPQSARPSVVKPTKRKDDPTKSVRSPRVSDLISGSLG
jgi:hypothetical protein